MSRENAFGHDLDPRVAPDARLAAHPIADRVADALAAERRHALRGGARRESPRLEHDDRCRPSQAASSRRAERASSSPRPVAPAAPR